MDLTGVLLGRVDDLVFAVAPKHGPARAFDGVSAHVSFLSCGTLRITDSRKVGKSLARVFLTGGLRLDGPTGSFSDNELPGGQGRIAFAALAMLRRPIPRDTLAEIVWDGRPPSKWDGALSAIVSRIRALLSGAGLDGKQVLTASGGTYAVRLPPDTWVDLEDAYRRLDRAQGALRHGDLPTATAEGTVAVGILRRPFLSGLDSEWIDGERRRQHDALHAGSVVLASAWLELDDPVLAATLASAAIATDPLREVGHRLLVRAEWRRGDRGAAMRALAECERVLVSELGVGPSPETLALAAEIRSA